MTGMLEADEASMVKIEVAHAVAAADGQAGLTGDGFEPIEQARLVIAVEKTGIEDHGPAGAGIDRLDHGGFHAMSGNRQYREIGRPRQIRQRRHAGIAVDVLIAWVDAGHRAFETTPV